MEGRCLDEEDSSPSGITEEEDGEFKPSEERPKDGMFLYSVDSDESSFNCCDVM